MVLSTVLVLSVTLAALIQQAHLQSGFNYVKCDPNWSPLGCSIGFHRSLKILLDDRKPSATVKINWDNVSGYRDYLRCRCHDQAKAGGYKWFAINNEGICLSHKGLWADYVVKNPVFPNNNLNCTGVISQVPQKAPDGSQCVLGGYRAYFYHIKEKVSADREGEGEAPPPKEGAPPTKACKKTSDLFLIIDSSGSVTSEGYKLVKTFLKKFLARYNVGKEGTSRVAIVTYDHLCHPQLNWSKSSKMTKAQIDLIVDSMPYSGGGTRTDVALQCARKFILKEKRPNVPITVFTMTDGRSWKGHLYVKDAAKALRDIDKKMIKMVAVGIGDEVHSIELQRITGKTDNLKLKDFQELVDKNSKTLNDIISATCTNV